jgi:hypothetical protein
VNRQAHPDSLRRQARTVYETHGTHRAAAVTGIPPRTIRRWARLEQWPRQPATRQPRDQRLRLVSADTQPAPPKLAPSGRPRLAMRVRVEVFAALDQLAHEREQGRSGAARNWAIVLGVLTDKLLALEAREQATGPLDPATAVARLAELVDVCEGRDGTDG